MKVRRIEYQKAHSIVNAIDLFEQIEVNAADYKIPNLRKYLCEIGGKVGQRYTTEVKNNTFFILRTK